MAQPKLVPLQQWICDDCGQLITSVEHGWVEWKDARSPSLRRHDFRIVHHAPSSPRNIGNSREQNCYYSREDRGGDLPLRYFVGASGIAELTTWLDDGEVYSAEYEGPPSVSNIRQWVELFRRLHLPYYEEARSYLAEAYREYGDSTPGAFYTPERLKGFIEEFGEED